MINSRQSQFEFARRDENPSPPASRSIVASEYRGRSRLFYGVAGEGLGHASRAIAVIEQLPECEVHVFTFGKAYEYFAARGYPFLHRINGMMFSYRRGRVNYPATLWNAGRYWLAGMRRNIREIARLAGVLSPDLFLTDFEPSMIRVAHRLNKPVASIDNQHKFVHCESAALPRFLRAYAWLTGLTVQRMIPRPSHTVIATFHADRLKGVRENVTLTGGILRRDVERLIPSNEGFVLAYIRDSVGMRILRALANCGRDVRVYGASAELRAKFSSGFDFRELSPEFVRDLAACDRVVSTAGNQLIGECRYFGKPILAIPEPGQYEQHVNAWFVEQIGLGVSCDADALSPQIMDGYLNSFSPRAERIPNGVHDAVRVLRRLLSEVNHAGRQDAVSVRCASREPTRPNVGPAGVPVTDQGTIAAGEAVHHR